MSLALDENLRRALASALRALEERRSLARKLEKQAEKNNHARLAASWARRGEEYEKERMVIRDSVRRLDETATHNNIKQGS